MRATFLVLALSMAMLSTTTLADVPGMINYQGTLTDEYGVALDTTVSMTFSIYTDSVAGTQVWTEAQLAVAVDNGLFNVLLGSVNAIPDTVFNGLARWLGVQVEGDPEIMPRQGIAAVGYAFRTAEADTADYARMSLSDGDWTISGSDMYAAAAGNVGIGTTSPQSLLSVGGAGVSGVTFYVHNSGSGNYGYMGGFSYGAYGHHNSGNYGYLGSVNYGAYGLGNVYGVCGQSVSGQGVYGWSSSGNAVHGNSSNGYGVYGHSGSSSGVYGDNDCGNYGTMGSDDHGVYGEHDSTGNFGYLGGSEYGALGAHSSGNYGYLGSADFGVYGHSGSATGVAVRGYNSSSGAGVVGQNANGNNGILAEATYGVKGSHSSGNVGYLGRRDYGVYGHSDSSDYAVYGYHDDEGNYGFLGGDSIAVFGHSDSDYAGYFDGQVHIQGTLDVGVDETGYDVNFYGASSGSRVLWNQEKMAFRAGRDGGTEWVGANVGYYSFGANYSTKASGTYSSALGFTTVASGEASAAMGRYATASGDYSLAIGRGVTAGPADYSIVLGSGVDEATRLVNNISNSFMVGFDSTTPTLFVGGAGNRVGIGTTYPTEDLHVVGNIYCTGKLTVDGGTDPPYVLYDFETRKAIVERVAREIPEAKRRGAVLFWNGEESRFEVYLPAQGEFRDLMGSFLAEAEEFHAELTPEVD